MSLLQYGFERKRIRDDLLQNDQVSDNEDNSNKDIKKPCIANSKTFKLKWLIEFSWLHYNENNKRMYYTLYIQHKKKINLLQKEQQMFQKNQPLENIQILKIIIMQRN